MKTPRIFLGVFAGLIAPLFLYVPTAFAEQGYADFQVQASVSHVAVGGDISVAAYIYGRQNAQYQDTQYGKVTLSIESWLPGDANPRGFEFVRFDPSGSDFPIDDGMSVTTGAYNYQCRTVEREASADMTGRHYFGNYVFRAVNPGTYYFAPSLPCRSIIESLTGNWGVVWDYGGSYVTVDQPASPASTPLATSPTPVSPSPQLSLTTNKNSSPHTATKEGTVPSTAVKGAQTTTTQSMQPVGATTDDHTLVKKKTDTNWMLPSLLFPALLALALAIWKMSRIRGHSKIEKHNSTSD
ncbi:MAG TPA: hypothetical protein VLG92_02060 [Candidatus Saccharimonadia bacterium]|nr:hypothetical protein [Candidatus Saccharimonadia bacterium]